MEVLELTNADSWSQPAGSPSWAGGCFPAETDANYIVIPILSNKPFEYDKYPGYV